MKVFLSGASGFIGSHTVRALSARGHEITCLLRPSRRSQARSRWLSRLPGVRLVQGHWIEPHAWLSAVAGHDAVVNTVGIIRETGGATFDAVHTEAPVALFSEAARCHARVVQISAMGADAGAQSRFHRSKRRADEYLIRLSHDTGLSYAILRPSFVYGPADHFMTFFARLAALPITPVPGDGHMGVQPLYISDLVRAIVASVEREDKQHIACDVGGGQILTFEQMLMILARHQGKSMMHALHIPWPLLGIAAAITDLLGGHGPITGDELLMLRRGSYSDNAAFVAGFGFEPIAFEQGLARYRAHSG